MNRMYNNKGFTRILIFLKSLCDRIFGYKRTKRSERCEPYKRSVGNSSNNLVHGFTLIEAVIYVALLVILLVVITSTIIGMASSYHSLVVVQNISDSSASVLERMTREIRNAESVDVSGSTFGNSSGVLVLNSTDDSGGNITREFFVLNGRIHIKEDGVDMGPLTMDRVEVTNLEFEHLTSAISEAVKVEITLEAGVGENERTENFYSTAVLRGSYQN